MEQVWRSVRPLLPLIPIGIVAVVVVSSVLAAIRIRRGDHRRSACYRSIVDVCLAASIISVLILTLPPSIGAPRTFNLVPFSELRHAVGDFGVSQLAGNAIMLMPFGFLAPLRWPRLDSFRNVIFAAAAFSLVIELLQFALPIGRQTSVTDIFMNTVGAATGYTVMLAARGLVRYIPRRPVAG